MLFYKSDYVLSIIICVLMPIVILYSHYHPYHRQSFLQLHADARLSVIFLNAETNTSMSHIVPKDFIRSTSSKKSPVSSGFNLFFSANFIARVFSSFFDEYLFGISPSMKSNMSPHLACPIVGVDGFEDVFI